MRSFYLVAEPGVAPGLGDYAFCFSDCSECRTISYLDFYIGSWRIVSTDSLRSLTKIASVFPDQIGIHRYSQVIT